MSKYLVQYCKALSIFLIVGIHGAICQTQIPNNYIQKLEAVPPSPQAADLGKYGEIPVGHQTGIPNISIPIYTIKLNDFILPISLTYHSMGNKVV